MKIWSLYVEVSDFELAIDFYRKLFGRERSTIVFQEGRPDRGAVFVPEGGDLTVFVAYQQDRSHDIPKSGIWLEIATSNLTQAMTLLSTGESTPRINIDPRGQRGFDVFDPDGRKIRVSELS
jgi:uncharacterized glyoxalase superfamily protein PhnB